MTLILLLALGGATVRFDILPPERRPTPEAVERVLALRPAGFAQMTMLGGSDSFLTRWHPRVVVDVHWQFDNRRVVRVNRVSFRLRRDKENLLPWRP
jgi:hypothetical protein